MVAEEGSQVEAGLREGPEIASRWAGVVEGSECWAKAHRRRVRNGGVEAWAEIPGAGR